MAVVLGGKNGIYLASFAGPTPPPVLDPDAVAFLTAAGITDPTIESAINTLVVDMKTASIWTKMKAVYPFVGGTASTHKWNLVNPLDTDAAFRLNFIGGWTHSANGALPNGTNGYANTHIISNISFNNITFSAVGYYSRTNTATTSSEYDCGSSGSGNPHLQLILRRSTNLRIFASDTPTGSTYRGAGDSLSLDGRGFFIGTQQGTNARLFVNGINVTSNNFATTSTAINNLKNFIGALNVSGSPSLYGNKECALWFASTTLTNSEAIAFNAAVNTFQTTLSRNV
jgi:hypothetical protein